MLYFTKPKSNPSNQINKNSSYFKLIVGAFVILALLTIIQVSMIFISNDETKRNEAVDLSGQNSTFRFNKPPVDDESQSIPSDAKLTSDENGAFNDSTSSRLRRNDNMFIPAAIGLSQPEVPPDHNRKPVLQTETTKPPKFVETKPVNVAIRNFVDLENISKSGDGIKRVNMENMNESVSESINRGTLIVGADSSRSQKFNQPPAVVDNDDMSMKPVETELDEASDFRDSEQPTQQMQANMNNNDESSADIMDHRIVQPYQPSPAANTVVEPEQQMGEDIERNPSVSSTNKDEMTALDDDLQDQNGQRNYNSNQMQQKPLLQADSSVDQSMLDQIPESMDSLMNSSEQEDLVELNNEENNNPSQVSQPSIEDGKQQLMSQGSAANRRKSPYDPDEDLDELDRDDDMNIDDTLSEGKPVAAVRQDSAADKADLSSSAGYHYSKKHHGHGHGHDHGKYYMYAKVPKKKSWEFGYKRGNKKHWIERHEKGHKNKFKTKVKWYDKKGKGKGIHIWDYNHHDKKKKHYG